MNKMEKKKSEREEGKNYHITRSKEKIFTIKTKDGKSIPIVLRSLPLDFENTFTKNTDAINHEIAMAKVKFSKESKKSNQKINNTDEEKTPEMKKVGKKINVKKTGKIKGDSYLYKCELCGKHFPTEFKYMHHLKTHLKQKNITCKNCGKNFIFQEALEGHERMKFICRSCGNTIPHENIQDLHMQRFIKEYKNMCEKNGKEQSFQPILTKDLDNFKSKEKATIQELNEKEKEGSGEIIKIVTLENKVIDSDALEHEETDFSIKGEINVEKNLSSNITKDKPKIFLKPLNLLLQKNDETSTSTVSTIPDTLNTPKDSLVLTPSNIQSTSIISNLTPKKQTAEDTTLSNQSKSVEITCKDKEKKEITIIRKFFKCSFCNITMKFKDKFIEHKNKYRCKMCEYGCCQLQFLNVHFREEHGLKTFCSFCSKEFPSLVNLAVHKKKVHFCTKCNKYYANLKEHKFNYICQNCEFRACNSINLDAHYKMVHNITTRCSSCKIIFDSMEIFQQHKDEIHYCQKCNSYKMDLNVHKNFCKVISDEDQLPVDIIELDDSD